MFEYLIATDESGEIAMKMEDQPDESEDPASIKDDTGTKEGSNSTIGQIQVATRSKVEGLEEADQSEAQVLREQDDNRSKKRKRDGLSSLKPFKKSKPSSNQTSKSITPHRGLDFLSVSCVLNFDFPPSLTSYIHRIGRTARAGKTGISLSFISLPSKSPGKWWVSDPARDEKALKEVERWSEGNVKEYRIEKGQVEGFRYRMEDALKGVTKALVRDTRLKVVKKEVVNSERLKSHFTSNPSDLQFLLQHDTSSIKGNRINPEMRHVPNYLMPRIVTVGNNLSGGDDGRVNGREVSFGGEKRGRNGSNGRGRGRGRGRGGKKGDPLRKFGRK